jgi:hypothetical protein
MRHETAVQTSTAIGVSVYRGLVALYPPAFRREFASDMIQDFEDASHEAWANDHWRGVLSLWVFTGFDVMRNVLAQWTRSGALIVTALALMTATSSVAVGLLDLRVRYTMRPSSPERDGVLVLILVTTVVVIIAATVIFSLIFLRPALTRHAGRRRV